MRKTINRYVPVKVQNSIGASHQIIEFIHSWNLQIAMIAPSFFSLGFMSPQTSTIRRKGLAFGILMLVSSLAQVHAAPPFLDANGYYWSETKTDDQHPGIMDRAELQLLTNGKAQWVLNIDGSVIVKPAMGEFYEISKNPRLNELISAIGSLRATNSRLEENLELTLRRSIQLADPAQIERFTALLAKLRKGEKGPGIEAMMNEFIVVPDTRRLLADRDQGRKSAFDQMELINLGIRWEFSQRVVGTVGSTLVAERALIVPITSGSKPLEVDDSVDSYSESLGIAYHLISQPDGNFYAILNNKPIPGSLCDNLELMMGDAVVAINDRPIRTASDLERVAAPQVIITIAKQIDGKPTRLAVQFIQSR